MWEKREYDEPGKLDTKEKGEEKRWKRKRIQEIKKVLSTGNG